MKYEARVTRWSVMPVGDNLFSERGTSVEIDDEGAGGEFVSLLQNQEGAKISIDPGEWSVLRDVIDKAVAACRKDKA